MQGIAARIRTSREKKGLSAQAAAELAGVSQSSWSDWENEVCAPRGSNRLKVAIALGVSSEWLRTGLHEGSLEVSQVGGPSEELIASAIAVSANYLELFHRTGTVDLSRQIELAQIVVRKCAEVGVSSAEELTLLQLHEALHATVFS